MERVILCVMLVLTAFFSFSQEQEDKFSPDNEIVRVARLRKNQEMKVIMFPNPCFGELTLQTEPNARVLVVDETGREMGDYLSREYGQLFIGDLLTGFYHVVVISGNKRSVSRLVVL